MFLPASLKSVARGAAVLAVAAAAINPGVGMADVAQDVSADLAMSGVPVASVVVVTPPPALVPLDTINSASLSLDGLMPYFSPTYQAPRPVVRIALDVPDGTPLVGIIQTPGLPAGSFTTTQAQVLVWRLAAVEAVKHAVARGATVGAIEIDLHASNGIWRSLQALPDPTVWPSQQPGLPTMSTDAVRAAVIEDLPSWVRTITTVDVTADAASRRVVRARLSLPVATFGLHNVREVGDALMVTQADLITRGGNVGRTIVRIDDSVTGDSLYVSADDRLWGYLSEWISPLAEGLEGFQRSGASPTPPAAEPPDSSPAPNWTPPLVVAPPQR